MSGNFHDRINENMDGFNLSKEDLMNCFGSQICSQSSSSNYDYQEECIPSDKKKNNCPNQVALQNKEENSNNPKIFENFVNKDDFLRNICHGFVDMFFSQKEELKGIKEEIKNLQNLIISNNNNKKSLTKAIKINNQKYSAFNQNNYTNNNELFNKNSKKNNLKINNNQICESKNKQLNQLKIQIKEEKNDQKNKHLSNLGNTKLFNTKSPNINDNQKSSVPETVLEVDEEYELTSTNKPNKIREKEKEKNDFEDPFMPDNCEENNNFKWEDIHDEEFDQMLIIGKNKKDNKGSVLGSDPFIKSSELKKRPTRNSLEKENTNLDNSSNNKENKENQNIENNSNNLDNFNINSDEIVSDFMVGGKKISIKLNDDIRQKINSFDEPIYKLEDLDKNKEPSNILHKTSKLSSTSIVSKKNSCLNNNTDIIKHSDDENQNKDIIQSTKQKKRNYNTMIDNSKKIIIKGEKNIKNDENKKIGSSLKDRGGFRKKLRKFGNSNEYNINSEILTYKNDSNPNSLNNIQNNVNKIINKEKYMYSTISSFQFYCICTKNNDNKENQVCQICKNNGVININNFRKGFVEYVLNIKKNNTINSSDNNFNLLKLDTISEKAPNFEQFKELEQFFNYQFIYLTYDKYLKISRENGNNDKIKTENLIEEIYDKLIPKYIDLFIKVNKSFLTEILESETKFGYMNILLFLMNINNTDSSTGEKTIEFSDGYKSCFAVISKDDPINKLLDQMILHNWMNVEIGMWKVVNITDDAKIFIKIYYNSISSVNNFDLIKNYKYRPLLDEKYLPKNILDLSNDGGEISLINVIIIKRYNYYVNNITKKLKISRKKYEDEIVKIPEVSSDKKNNSNSEGKNNNLNEIKEPDKFKFNFKAIAMDYEIYNNLKKKQNNKNIDHLLKKKYIIEFSTNYNNIFENIIEGKMYQLMFLNLEHINHPNSNSSLNTIINKKTKHFFNYHKDNDILIKFTEKSQINEIQLGINYKSDKEYLNAMELINKQLNLTNNIDIGRIFIENLNNNKEINDDNYFNKEYCISGIFSGFIDKIKYYSSSEKNGNDLGNEEQYTERYIFLSIGEEKIAIIKLHKDDFFNIDVKSNKIKDKIITFNDIVYKEIIYFDNDNSQPKITGRKKLENSIPLLNLETNPYTSISFGNNSKNKEQLDLFMKFNEYNKSFVEILAKIIG